MGAPRDRVIPVGLPHRTLCDVEMLVYDFDRTTVSTAILPARSLFKPWEPLEHWRGVKVPITRGIAHTGFDWGVDAGEGHFLRWDDFFSACVLVPCSDAAPPPDPDCYHPSGLREMPVASRTSWPTEPLPERRAELDYHPEFTHREAETLIAGLVPRTMEDKWFVFHEDGWLFFHRSWTGTCIFWMRLTGTPNGVRAAETWVNRDPDQFHAADAFDDQGLLDMLIQSLLQRRA